MSNWHTFFTLIVDGHMKLVSLNLLTFTQVTGKLVLPITQPFLVQFRKERYPDELECNSYDKRTHLLGLGFWYIDIFDPTRTFYNDLNQISSGQKEWSESGWWNMKVYFKTKSGPMNFDVENFNISPDVLLNILFAYKYSFQFSMK